MVSPLPVGTVRFSSVSKRYEIPQKAAPRLGAWLLSKAFEHFRREPFDALRDVTFEIAPGEMVGLVGGNGAGKSSILKLIAGITEPTSGSVEVSGSVTSLLELGVGFHPELTGMENIFYNGTILGMSQETILRRLPEIIAFSGLEGHLYESVKHYSSGMYSRLACAVALHLEPTIILVDEILSVGDAAFQAKSIGRLLQLHRQGVTTVLVTHETATARDICDRLLWVDEGRVREYGNPREVHEAYHRSMTRAGSRTAFGVPPQGDRGARVTAVNFRSQSGSQDSVRMGESATVEVEFEADREASVGLLWKWGDGRILWRDTSPTVQLDGQSGRGRVVYTIPRWPLLKCQVSVDVAIFTGNPQEFVAHEEDILRLNSVSLECPFDDTLVSPRQAWKWSE